MTGQRCDLLSHINDEALKAYQCPYPSTNTDTPARISAHIGILSLQLYRKPEAQVPVISDQSRKMTLVDFARPNSQERHSITVGLRLQMSHLVQPLMHSADHRNGIGGLPKIEDTLFDSEATKAFVPQLCKAPDRVLPPPRGRRTS